MAFQRKNLGSGQLGASETTIYTPNVNNLTGIVGSLTFFNTSSTSQVTVTVYAPHTGSASTSDIMEKFTINPEKTHLCREMVNKVIEGGTLISALASTDSVVNYSCSGGEE